MTNTHKTLDTKNSNLRKPTAIHFSIASQIRPSLLSLHHEHLGRLLSNNLYTNYGRSIQTWNPDRQFGSSGLILELLPPHRSERDGLYVQTFLSQPLMPRSPDEKQDLLMLVLILGLDGLEYNLVKKWALKNLLQRQHAKIEVPRNEEKKMPLSPEVWAEFLTGRSQNGVEFEQSRDLRSYILSSLVVLRENLPIGFGLGRHFTHRSKRRFPDLKCSSFVDFDCVEEINVPYYSYDHKGMEDMRLLNRRGWTIQHVIYELVATYNERKRQIAEGLKNSRAEIVFAFMHFPDLLQHFWLSEDSAESLYRSLDGYFRTLRKYADTTWIISDHGYDFETSRHSEYGFFSSSRPLAPIPQKMTDFYGIIYENMLGYG